MRKLFLFATVAAAGLFASCSSSDDVVDAGNPAIENDGDKQAIKIGIGNMANIDETRGTGTVGGVGTGLSNGNVWAGQRVNVFMFTKDANKATTLNLTPAETAGTFLYNNSVMITPGTAENLIPNMGATAELASGEAMLEDGTINYYPVQGNYDFFGYHGDDATGAVAMNGNPTVYYAANDAEVTAGTKKVGDIKTNTTSTRWTVPFTIDGSQDLMSAKAILTHIEDDPGTNNVNESESGQDYIMSQAPAARQNDYYSAYAARKGVQPTLTFDHLLTRLQFKVKAGDKESAGYGEEYQLNNYSPVAITDAEYTAFTNTTHVDKATYWNADGSVKAGDPTLSIEYYAELSETDQAFFTPNYVDGYDPERAVKIESIQVLSRETKGNMLVAWTASEEVAAVAPATGTYMPAYKKIEWATTQTAEADRWLTLKERAYYKLNEGATPEDNDVIGYATAKAQIVNSDTYDATDNTTWSTLKDKYDGATAALTAAETALSNAEAALALLQPGDAGYDAALQDVTDAQTAKTAAQTAKTNAKKDYDDAVALEAARKPSLIVKSTISKNVYDELLTAAGQAKYADIHDNNINADLAKLSPTAPKADENHNTFADFVAAQTPVGEALIIAPNVTADGTTYTAEPLKMRVTISQKVPTNWKTPRKYEYRTSSYDLDIPVPGGNGAGSGAFKINNSYNIVLTVYGFSRIDVIAEVEEWKDGGVLPVGQD